MDSMRKYVLKYQFLRLRCMLIPSAEKRSAWLKKHNYFYEMGENVHFQPRKLPADPKFIKLHNNISIASSVSFVTHDIIHYVFNNCDEENRGAYKSHLGCIEIMDNVFIGSGTRIMPNVRIGPNAIVASGAIVTKDVPEGSIVAGVPARVIGKFDDLMKARLNESKLIDESKRLKRVEKEWAKFYESRNTSAEDE